jgi:hypothetical protein
MAQPAGSGLWQDVQIAPVEIALPDGVGFTLRAYRLSTDLEPPEIDSSADEHDSYTAAAASVLAQRRRGREEDVEDEVEDDGDDPVPVDFRDSALAAEGLESADEDEDESAEQIADSDEVVEEDVPVFLGRRGKVYLFRSAEKLVEFVKSTGPGSDAEHDLTQLDTWPELSKRITAADVEPAEDDQYELDLVVQNLRGGPDSWDHTLLIRAGELARDLGYALRIEPVISSLSAGSPLDDLDETLRAAEAGGPKAFFAKRKLRRMGEQQTAIGWRTIIGKISASVDWRD